MAKKIADLPVSGYLRNDDKSQTVMWEVTPLDAINIANMLHNVNFFWDQYDKTPPIGRVLITYSLISLVVD